METKKSKFYTLFEGRWLKFYAAQIEGGLTSLRTFEGMCVFALIYPLEIYLELLTNVLKMLHPLLN